MKAIVDRLDACRQHFMDRQKSYRDELNEILGEAYELGLDLWKSRSERTRLYRRPYFLGNRTKPAKDRRRVFKHVCQFVMQAVSGAALKRASKYARALEALASQDIVPSKAAKVLKSNGGIEKVHLVGKLKTETSSREAASTPRLPKEPKSNRLGGLDLLRSFRSQHSRDLIIQGKYKLSENGAEITITGVRKRKKVSTSVVNAAPLSSKPPHSRIVQFKDRTSH